MIKKDERNIAMQSGFFAMLSRMKYINRWALMRNTEHETLSEHTLETAFIAHALAVLRNTRLGGSVDPAQTALMALFHDVPEILVGDMPTPVKYHSTVLRTAFGEVESAACDRLLTMLPEELRGEYEPLLREHCSEDMRRIIKAADKLSALIKCIEERKAGNMEFANAEQSTLESIKAMELPEAQIFIDEFLPGYSLTIDELGKL